MRTLALMLAATCAGCVPELAAPESADAALGDGTTPHVSRDAGKKDSSHPSSDARAEAHDGAPPRDAGVDVPVVDAPVMSDDAGGCAAGCGPCEACVNGACASTCSGCESCSAGACTSTCGACETCNGGACASTCGACEACSGGVCASTCTASQTCSGGACVCAPSCASRSCGDDTCGNANACGGCQSNFLCSNFLCVGACYARCCPAATCGDGALMGPEAEGTQADCETFALDNWCNGGVERVSWGDNMDFYTATCPSGC